MKQTMNIINNNIKNYLFSIILECDIQPLAIYLYGSRVYGNITKTSDWDFVIINDDKDFDIEDNFINIKLLSKEIFQHMLYEHEISALECLFLPQNLILKSCNNLFTFILDKSKLRSSISAKASNSWVKSKKKFINPYENVENELIRGKKSLFHSLRILDFGTQIAKYNKIQDYSNCNEIFYKIINNKSEDWKEYEKEYKPIFNKMASDFRLVAPK